MPGIRRVAVVIAAALAAFAPAWSQTAAWQSGVAKVTLRAELNRKPATAFVVAAENGRAWLVTSAHVVEGDPSPQIEFVAAPRASFQSTVNHVEAGDKHGLALLEVANPPAGLQVLEPAPRPAIGQKVSAAGFPASLGNFTILDTSVATYDGRELVLGLETEEGFSGGPVLAENGRAAGLVFGNRPRYGLAVQAADVRTYLEGRGLFWGTRPMPAGTNGGTRPQPAAPKAGDVRVNPADGLTYVYIPPGSFRMGCSPGDGDCWQDEFPAHTEQIKAGFWLGQTEVTQAAWKKVNAGDNPSQFKGDRLPVENITWNEAVAYCKAAGGRLPGEKEWEYAARAGSKGALYGTLDGTAWHKGNSGGTTHPVSLKQPNTWGLHDMLGNVFEWTADTYNRDTQLARGGSWDSGPVAVRVSIRVGNDPAGRFNFIGLRCVTD